MRTRIFLLALILCVAGLAACNDEGNIIGSGGNTLEPKDTNNTKTDDTLICTWELVKITGGIHGQGDKVECSEILKINRQNTESPLNYEWWKCDTLFQKNKFTMLSDDFLSMFGSGNGYKFVNIEIENDYPYSHVWAFRIFKIEDHLFMELMPAVYDAYVYHFRKVNGGNNE